MHRFMLALVLAAAASAQAPNDLFTRAPQGVEEALRARIHQFYQAHVDGKFREAEKLVAEDTKEFFYSSNKPKYLKFEIYKIDFSDDFTKAKVTMKCEQIVLMPGFSGPLQVPSASYWKMENGDWFWYVDQKELRKTPFGEVDTSKGGATGSLPTIPGEAQMGSMLAAVKADRSAVTLETGKTAEVQLVNTAKGPVTLAFYGAMPQGVEAMYDHIDLKQDEKAVLRIRASEGKPTGTIQVRVNPTNQIIPIQISTR